MKREPIAILVAFSALLFTTACGTDPDDIAAILQSADIADNVLMITVPEDSTLHYQTCMEHLDLFAEGSTDPLKNTPDKASSFSVAQCGYWIDDIYHRPTGLACDVVECAKAAGRPFYAYIGRYQGDGTKPIPVDITVPYCNDALIMVAIPHTGTFTADLKLYTDAACQEPVSATAEFNNK